MPFDAAVRWSFAIQCGVWIAAGAGVLALAWVEWRSRADADTFLLVSWMAGTFVFAGFINWTPNGRSMLPMVIPAGILVARRILRLSANGRTPLAWRNVAIPLALSAVVSLAAANADASFAGAFRFASDRLAERNLGASQVWFEGHWGFQYYMQRWGAKPIDIERSSLRPGDLVAIPDDHSNIIPLPPDRLEPLGGLELPPAGLLATVRPLLGASFHGGLPLPFAIGPPVAQQVRLFRVRP